MNEKNEQAAVEEAPVTAETASTPEAPPLPEGATHPPTPEDPEGDGLTKGQTSPDVHGDVLGL